MRHLELCLVSCSFIVWPGSAAAGALVMETLGASLWLGMIQEWFCLPFCVVGDVLQCLQRNHL